jgi:acetyl-CoA synthetase
VSVPTSAGVWRPEQHAWTRDSHVARFMRTRGVGSLTELRQAAVHCHQWFWDEALRDMGLEWTHRYTHLRDMSRGFPWTRWFGGGEINLTHNCVDRHVRDGHGNDPALRVVSDGTDGEIRTVSFAALAERVDRAALALRAAGVQHGDNVAAAEIGGETAVVAMLAAWKLGARYVQLAGASGGDELRAQLERGEVRLLLARSHRTEGNQAVDTKPAIRAVVADVPSVLRVVWTDTADWEEFLQSGVCWVPQRDPFSSRPKPAFPCEMTRAEEPALIVFIRDRAGRLNATVHTHAGCLAQAGKDLRYAYDVRAGEPVLWLGREDAGVGPWTAIGCLLYRAPLVVMDAALAEDAARVWRSVERLGVVTLGGQPDRIARLKADAGDRGAAGFDLSRLRVVGMAARANGGVGQWLFERVGGGRCPLISVAWSAELLGGWLQPYPVEAITPGSLGGPALGIDADVFTEDGRPAERGNAGLLVCKQPVPSMTKGFLRDDATYVATHFDRFRGVCCLGERVIVAPDGQWFPAE